MVCSVYSLDGECTGRVEGRHRVAFVDLKAAFDSVDRNALWEAMRGIGVPSV